MLKTACLTLCERLKDEGFPQYTCYFSWGRDKDGQRVYPTEGTSWRVGIARIADAPTAEEILTQIHETGTKVWVCHGNGMWIVNLVDFIHESDSFYGSDLVVAAAQAWLGGKRSRLIL